MTHEIMKRKSPSGEMVPSEDIRSVVPEMGARPRWSGDLARGGPPNGWSGAHQRGARTRPVPPGVPEKASETLSLYGTQHPASPWDAGDPWHAPEVEQEWGAR